MPRGKIKLSWQEFYEINQAAGTVKLALRDDPGFRLWYKTKRKR